MKVMGVDPGVRATGYGVVEGTGGNLRMVDWGLVKTRPEESFSKCLWKIFTELKGIVSAQKLDGVAVENAFYAKNVKTALKMGQARGAAVIAGVDAGMEVRGYSPMEVKQAVVGYGRASKEQVREMVKVLLKLEEAPRPQDVVDALAVAICHIHTVGK